MKLRVKKLKKNKGNYNCSPVEVKIWKTKFLSWFGNLKGDPLDITFSSIPPSEKERFTQRTKKQLFFNDLFNESLTTKLNIPSVSGPVQESSFFPKTLATVNSKGRLYHQL